MLGAGASAVVANSDVQLDTAASGTQLDQVAVTSATDSVTEPASIGELFMALPRQAKS